MTAHTITLAMFPEDRLVSTVERAWGQGGFTLDSGGKFYISRRADEFILSLAGTEQVFDAQPSTDEVRQYMQRYVEQFNQPGLYLGGWVHGETTYYLDLSYVVFGHAEAISEAILQNQDYIYHPRSGQSLPVNPVLHRDRDLN